MAETMNMKELFALLVRRCRAVLLTALIFAVLFLLCSTLSRASAS